MVVNAKAIAKKATEAEGALYIAHMQRGEVLTIFRNIQTFPTPRRPKREIWSKPPRFLSIYLGLLRNTDS